MVRDGFDSIWRPELDRCHEDKLQRLHVESWRFYDFWIRLDSALADCRTPPGAGFTGYDTGSLYLCLHGLPRYFFT